MKDMENFERKKSSLKKVREIKTMSSSFRKDSVNLANFIDSITLENFEANRSKMIQLSNGAMDLAHDLHQWMRHEPEKSSEYILVDKLHDCLDQIHAAVAGIGGSLERLVQLKDSSKKGTFLTRKPAERHFDWKPSETEIHIAWAEEAVRVTKIQLRTLEQDMIRLTSQIEEVDKNLRRRGVKSFLRRSGQIAATLAALLAIAPHATSEPTKIDKTTQQEEESEEEALFGSAEEMAESGGNNVGDIEGMGQNGDDLFGSASDVGDEVSMDLRSEGEPGKFRESAKPLAKIDFSFFNSISDPLWVNMVAHRTSNGKFVRAEVSPYMKVGEHTHATVTAKIEHPQVNKPIKLLVPYGFTATNIKIEPQVIFSHDLVSNSIRLEKKPGKKLPELNLSYEVHASSQEQVAFPLDRSKPIVRTEADEKLIVELGRAASGDIPAKLDKHLANFIYVVGKDFDRLFRKIPGTLEEKIGNLRVGDCDTLSAYSAGLLNDAQKYAWVASGYLETKGVIKGGRGHAKLLYKQDSENKLYETTAPTKRGLVNLVLTERDRKHLENVIGEMNWGGSPEARRGQYERLRREVHAVLNSREYDKFQTAPEMFNETEATDIRELLARIEKAIETSLEEGIVIPILGLLMALASLCVAGAFAITKAQRFSESKAREIKEENLRGTAELFHRISAAYESLPEPPGDTNDFFVKTLEQIYTQHPYLEGIIPLKEVREYNRERQKTFLKMIGMADAYMSDNPWRMLDGIRYWWKGRNWERMSSRIAADGVTLPDFEHAARALLNNKKTRAEMEKRAPEAVKYILESAQAELHNQNLLSIGSVPIATVLEELSLKSSLQGESAASRAAGEAASPEFGEHIKYAPGMDLRKLNWKAYARTGEKVIRRPPPEAGPQRNRMVFHLAIEVNGSGDGEIAHLAKLLLYVQQQSSKIKIRSFTFLAQGEVVGRIAGKSAAEISSRPDKKNIELLLKKIYDLKLEHTLAIDDSIASGEESILVGASSLFFPHQTIPPGESLLTLGFRDVTPPRDSRQIYEFTYKQEPEQAA